MTRQGPNHTSKDDVQDGSHSGAGQHTHGQGQHHGQVQGDLVPSLHAVLLEHELHLAGLCVPEERNITLRDQWQEGSKMCEKKTYVNVEVVVGDLDLLANIIALPQIGHFVSLPVLDVAVQAVVALWRIEFT